MMSKRATEKNNEDNDPCHRHVLNMMLLSCFMGAQEEGYFIKQKLHHSHTGGTWITNEDEYKHMKSIT